MNPNEDLPAPDKTPDIVELEAVEIGAADTGSAIDQDSAGGRNSRDFRDSPNRQKPDIFISQDKNCCSNCCLIAVLAALFMLISAIIF